MLKYLLVLIGLSPVQVMAESFPAPGSRASTCDSLWIARNQILNAAGYCFETPLGVSVFDNSDCTPGQPALPEAALNRIARLQALEAERGCAINTNRQQITANGRYGLLRFGTGEIELGAWPTALHELDVFPKPAGRLRMCTVSGLLASGDGFLALRSGPDVRYPQIGALVNGERVASKSVCMGRWCFADSVENNGRIERRNGWFHVRWCQP
jgi:hypothetical protein